MRVVSLADETGPKQATQKPLSDKSRIPYILRSVGKCLFGNDAAPSEITPR